MSETLYNRLAFDGYHVESACRMASGKGRLYKDLLETKAKVLHFYYQYHRPDAISDHFPSAAEIADFMRREWDSYDITIHDNQGNLIYRDDNQLNSL